TTMTTRSTRRLIFGGVTVSVALMTLVSQILLAQSFTSGSDGSDGALSFATAGTYPFDPMDTATFGRILDSDGDGVYNFTTINIPSGVTLKMPASKVNRPIYWLASGAVTIGGVLELSGEATTIAPS